MSPALRLPEVMPQHVTIASVHGPGVVRRREIKDPVYFENGTSNIRSAAESTCSGVGVAFTADNGRRTAEPAPETSSTASPAGPGPGRHASHPSQRQVLDVRLTNLNEPAVTLAGIITGVSRPVTAQWFE